MQKERDERVKISGIFLLFPTEQGLGFFPSTLLWSKGAFSVFWEDEVVVWEGNEGPERVCSRVWPYI
jgi:hypothetical protein